MFQRRVIGLLVAGVLLIGGGTLGYVLIEGWRWNDALYMTIITLSTVGYGEVGRLSDAGRTFSMVLIVLGVGGAAYTFSVVTDFIVAGELRGFLRRQRMVKGIARMREHYIICGYGRVGQQVVEGLLANHFGVVVIDTEPEIAEELDARDIPYLIGDASNDDLLRQAGVVQAAGVCTCLPSDAANVFTILTARSLNPNLYIISRGNVAESDHKLRMAGANQVINPYTITGHRMAAQLMHPGVVEFLEVVMRQGDLELRIEEIEIHPASNMAGRTLGECHVRGETGVNVLAVRRADGQLVTKLDADFGLNVGDTLVGLGTRIELAALATRVRAIANAAAHGAGHSLIGGGLIRI